jgi:hypothetical protein
MKMNLHLYLRMFRSTLDMVCDILNFFVLSLSLEFAKEVKKRSSHFVVQG